MDNRFNDLCDVPGAGFMSGGKRERVIRCNCKTINEMTPEERDEYFKASSGLTYAEFCEKYKDDTVEAIDKDFDEFIKNNIKHSV